MRVAIVGSRSLTVNNLESYIPRGTAEIISGGALGIDTCAREYAVKNNIKLTEILPEYALYGKSAPLKRNEEIIENCDIALIFWDGASKGTKSVIDICRKKGVRFVVYDL